MRIFKFNREHFEDIKSHLFPGDGLEVIAFILCGRTSFGDRTVFTSYKVKPIAYSDCTRSENRIEWNVNIIQDLIDEADREGLSLFKIHCHPGNHKYFSEVDNESDNSFFPVLNAELGEGIENGSLVMMQDGILIGRVVFSSDNYKPIDMFQVVGDTLQIQSDAGEAICTKEEFLRNTQAFGMGTQNLLQKMKIGIVGCSGTGSPTIEQLHRLGVGEIVTIDHDIIERKNLNRILHSTVGSIGKSKVDVLKKGVESSGLNTKVTVYKDDITESLEAITDFSTCDIVLGSTDSVLSRDFLTAMSSFYLLPYIDMGVKLSADGKGGIRSIQGVINYISPGDSLLERGMYTQEDLRAEGLLKYEPEEYKSQLKRGYVSNANVESPAVISVNMNISSFAVLDLLERIHPYRDEKPKRVKRIFVSLSSLDIITQSEFETDKYLLKHRGRGSVYPLMFMPHLSKKYEAA